MKFLFENSFDTVAGPATKAGPTKAAKSRTYTEQDIAAARATAYAEGEAAGHAAALTSIEQTSATVLTAIGAQLSNTTRQITMIRDGILADALEVVETVIRKVIPELAGRNALKEIEKLIGECLQAIYDEPRVVIRSHEQVIAALQKRIDLIGASSGFQGKIVLLADDRLTENDCRVEWADGGAERNLGDVLKQIDVAIETMTAGSKPPSPPPLASGKLGTGA